MHHTEIDQNALVHVADVDLGDSVYGNRTVALEGFALVNDCDLLVPVDPRNPEALILALTEEQAIQVILMLAGQIGKGAALAAVQKAEG